jgi:hypothetical protein
MDPKSIETTLLLSIDSMGQRYGMLPSEIVTKASTFDLVVMDMAMTYERHINESSQEGYIPTVSTEDLLKIKEKA